MSTTGIDDFDLAGLPNEVLAAMGKAQFQGIGGSNKDDQSRLDLLSGVISAKRDTAVRFRNASGIEDTWMDCEEAYIGIDDENRSEFVGAKWSKPMSMTGPLTSNARSNSSNSIKSSAFVRVTSRYVDAGSAKVGEILLPVDGKAFSFSATPVPDLIALKNSQTQVTLADGSPAMRDVSPDEMSAAPASDSGMGLPAAPDALAGPDANGMPQAPTAPGSAPAAGGAAAPAPVPLTYADLAQEVVDKANDAANSAEKRIYDWMVQSQYPAEMRKVIFDSSRIGTGVLKGPFPKMKRNYAVNKNAATGKPQLKIEDTTTPALSWVDPWNIFPDETCGEDIHNGDYIFERDFLSPRQVRDLLKNPAYIKDNVECVIKEGPFRSNLANVRDDQLNAVQSEEKRYEVWYFYGVLSREDMIECGAQKQLDALTDKEQKDVYAIVTLINDCVVRATINPLESGEFPYHVVPWRRRPSSWAGVGVSEQIRMPQRMINAGTRALLVNAAKTSGSQIVIDRGCIEPADKSWTITPDKLWYKTESATTDDVEKAFATFEFPNMQAQLMAVIDYGFRLAEESCSIPLISQGQSGPSTPDTLGGQQLQDNNANQLLRSIGYAFDDYVTEPVVRQLYEWLLLSPDVPDDEKGDWQINAHGSASLVERSIQNSTISQLLGASLNPAYGGNPYKTYEQYLRSQRLDPRDFQTPEEEFEQKQANAQPAPPPSIEVAKIRTAADISISKSRDATTLAQSRASTDRDNVYRETELERIKVERESAIEELKLRRELAMLDYSNKHSITLETLKVQLAKSTASEQTKRLLADAELTFAGQQNMYDRTHDKIKDDRNHEAKINPPTAVREADSMDRPPSLVRDEVSTTGTP